MFISVHLCLIILGLVIYNSTFSLISSVNCCEFGDPTTNYEDAQGKNRDLAGILSSSSHPEISSGLGEQGFL